MLESVNTNPRRCVLASRWCEQRHVVVLKTFLCEDCLRPVRYQNTDLDVSTDRAFVHGGISDFSTESWNDCQ